MIDTPQMQIISNRLNPKARMTAGHPRAKDNIQIEDSGLGK